MDNFLDINIFNPDTPIINSGLELFFQEIAIAVKVGPGEIWGVYDSIDISKYVFNKYVTINQIRNEIETFIGNNCSQSVNFVYNVDAQLLNVEDKELIYIEVKVYSDDNAEFINKFLLGE